MFSFDVLWYEYKYNDYREYSLPGSKSSTSLKSLFKKIKPHKKIGSGTEEEALILSTSDAGAIDIEPDDETVLAKAGPESETRNAGHDSEFNDSDRTKPTSTTL